MNQLNPQQAFQAAMGLQQQGRAADACAIYQQLLEHFPNDAQLLYSYGTAALQQGLDEKAELLFKRSLAFTPKNPGAHFNLGNTLTRAFRYEEAVESYTHAIALAPQISGGYTNRGNALMHLRRYEDALRDYEKVLALDGATANGLSNRGYALRKLYRFAEALETYDRAMAIRPDNAGLYCKKAMVFREMGRFQDELELYDRALKLKPDDARALVSRGRLLLRSGRINEGRQLYENRWRRKNFQFHDPHYKQPAWRGESGISGKRLLIWHEQGLGDFMMCARFATLAAASGAKVLLETPSPLIDLMQTLAGGITLFPYTPAPHKADPPDFDLHCPAMSLPLAFDADEAMLSGCVPYLSVDPERLEKWRARLGKKQRPRIGITWTGNKSDERDELRTIAVNKLQLLFDLPCNFHLLQPDIRAEHADFAKSVPNLYLHTDAIKDFADTAALMTEMDQIISVDTSAAHLAGALGLPLWILLPKVPDWRWMLEREDTPWYPTARLFRQNNFNDWEDVLQRVKSALQEKFQS